MGTRIVKENKQKQSLQKDKTVSGQLLPEQIRNLLYKQSERRLGRVTKQKTSKSNGQYF